MLKALLGNPKKEWGLCIFLLISTSNLVALVLRNVGAHYMIFTSAGNALLHETSPYGTTFGFGVGPYFYSQFCGLTVFAPLSLLPSKLGLIIYTIGSWFILMLGFQKLATVLGKQENYSLQQTPYRHLFWLMLGSELTGGMLAHKLEVMMSGMLLLSLALLLERRGFWAGVLISTTIAWKYQPLPILGLVATALVIQREGKLFARFVLGGVAAAAVAYLVPVLWLGHSASAEFTAFQHNHLNEFMRRVWLNFQNIYAFVNRNFGLTLDYDIAQRLSAGIGALFAAALAGALWMRRLNFNESLLAAFGFGAAYMNLFSPLSQSNAHILIAPLIAAIFYFMWKTPPQHQQKMLALALAGYYFTSIAFSELTPKPLLQYFRQQTYKPVGVLLLTVALFCLIAVSRRALSKTPHSG